MSNEINPAAQPTQAQRELVVKQLREEVIKGSLTSEEFRQLLDAAYSVQTHRELYLLLAGVHITPQTRPRPKRAVVIAVVLLGALIIILVASFFILSSRVQKVGNESMAPDTYSTSATRGE